VRCGVIFTSRENIPYSEIHDKLEGENGHRCSRGAKSFAKAIAQIQFLDIVSSLDSLITAVGMAQEVIIMVLAVIIAVGVRMASSKSVSDFVEKHPTVKMLALAFLLL
jgi:predicted tellurium resistance membrane protein TerC